MASHRKKRTAGLKALTKRQWMRVIAGCSAVVMLVGIGIATTTFHQSQNRAPNPGATAFSATENGSAEVSRDNVRKALNRGSGGSDSGTSYVSVKINGVKRVILGDHFTTVKSVLDAGDITLDPGDQVTPSLQTKVNESTTIEIERADASVKSEDSAIPFNTIEERTDSLPAGTRKVKTEGQNGVMETTSLITKAGSKSLSSNIFASFVKQAPVDKVILVGTGSGSASAPSASAGSSTTAPVGDSQALAHGLVLSRGWGEGEFTCLVQLWNKESGWRTNAANPSGAYGIPQALPGSKMGPGWESDANVQINWGLGYIASRYGTPCGAWAKSQASGWY
ncbi:putative secreted protein [Bifidobacterium actinocoloniiforme DSM 22766]|uniref:Putative secreted protein n=1 Tax=Bifidobacterium actinocoloniiforme DSM 22766 TaxID=1437605 RepID=A0A086YZD0_9BIFI|nr:G5 domain-containing protein [Bifidobacterium actinocoloniiforme]AKV54972.1 hypothetical protein AB656_00265 [Bifidobacterium actinocoloniiforme DSM 22766]KFI39630.1 putative secreted protein [Bifidobacterium actinocoloniiforme DSM 22766]